MALMAGGAEETPVCPPPRHQQRSWPSRSETLTAQLLSPLLSWFQVSEAGTRVARNPRGQGPGTGTAGGADAGGLAWSPLSSLQRRPQAPAPSRFPEGGREQGRPSTSVPAGGSACRGQSLAPPW